MADDDAYSYLDSLSAHRSRAGDTSNFNPAFASALANAIRQAREAGLPVSLMSGYRTPGQTGSAYDAGGNSSHSYGLASDVAGLDGPNGKITRAFAKIAEANGLHNPYGIGNKAEFNHWQLPEQPLEKTPQLLASLQKAAATGNFQNVWNAYNGAGGTAVASAAPGGGSGQALSQRDQHIQFIRDYAQKIGLNPDLALGIAGAEGLNAWSDKNPNAGSYVDRTNGQPWSFGDFQLNTRNGMGVDARKAGVDPSDPNQWQAADRFALDRMKAGGVGPWTDPVAKAYLATGKVQPFAGGPAVAAASGQPSGGSGTAAGAPAATPGPLAQGQAPFGSAGNLPGFTPDSPGAKMAAAGLKSLGLGDKGQGDGGQDDKPLDIQPSPMLGPQPMAVGGPMMIAPGGMGGGMGQRIAEQGLANQGFGLTPNMGDYTANQTRMPQLAPQSPGSGPPPGSAALPGAATGAIGIPGTTLNSPSALQTALLYGSLDPFDPYGRFSNATANPFAGSA